MVCFAASSSPTSGGIDLENYKSNLTKNVEYYIKKKGFLKKLGQNRTFFSHF